MPPLIPGGAPSMGRPRLLTGPRATHAGFAETRLVRRITPETWASEPGPDAHCCLSFDVPPGRSRRHHELERALLDRRVLERALHLVAPGRVAAPVVEVLGDRVERDPLASRAVAGGVSVGAAAITATGRRHGRRPAPARRSDRREGLRPRAARGHGRPGRGEASSPPWSKLMGDLGLLSLSQGRCRCLCGGRGAPLVSSSAGTGADSPRRPRPARSGLEWRLAYAGTRAYASCAGVIFVPSPR